MGPGNGFPSIVCERHRIRHPVERRSTEVMSGSESLSVCRRIRRSGAFVSMPSFLDPNGFGHTHRAAIRSSCGATLMIDFDLMAHPMETVLREAYAAFGRGDVDGYLQP